MNFICHKVTSLARERSIIGSTLLSQLCPELLPREKCDLANHVFELSLLEFNMRLKGHNQIISQLHMTMLDCSPEPAPAVTSDSVGLV